MRTLRFLTIFLSSPIKEHLRMYPENREPKIQDCHFKLPVDVSPGEGCGKAGYNAFAHLLRTLDCFKVLLIS